MMPRHAVIRMTKIGMTTLNAGVDVRKLNHLCNADNTEIV